MVRLFLLLVSSFCYCSAGNANAYARLQNDLFDDAGYDATVIPLEHPPESNKSSPIDLAVGVSLT